MKTAMTGAIGFILGAAAVAAAQVLVAPREPAPPMMQAGAVAAGSLVVAALSPSTAIAVKDQGEYQTVFLYTIGMDGKLEPTPQKMKFFYK